MGFLFKRSDFLCTISAKMSRTLFFFTDKQLYQLFLLFVMILSHNYFIIVFAKAAFNGAFSSSGASKNTFSKLPYLHLSLMFWFRLKLTSKSIFNYCIKHLLCQILAVMLEKRHSGTKMTFIFRQSFESLVSTVNAQDNIRGLNKSFK